MNRLSTVQPPRRAPRWLRALSPTAALAAGHVSVYGLGGLLEAVLTRAVVA